MNTVFICTVYVKGSWKDKFLNVQLGEMTY